MSVQTLNKKHWALMGVAAFVFLIAGGVFFGGPASAIRQFGLVLNFWRSMQNPPGTLTVEVRDPAVLMRAAVPVADDGAWPSYNRNLASQRYAPLDQISTETVGKLNVQCTYDTGLHENFEGGPLVVGGALIDTTEFDIFSIDPSTCHENWRTHEAFKAPPFTSANRGAAFLDGRLFRGTLDGRILAYDAKTGKRLWATAIADPRAGELVDVAPIAWNGLVFAGIAMSDIKGIKGRVYALAADTGRIIWETYTVPRSAGDITLGPEGSMPDTASETWQNAPEVTVGGGGLWTSFTLDTATGRLYIPVGNAGPAFMTEVRKGANLFTNTILILDAKTGDYIEHYDAWPGDWHDWDVSNTPSIVESRGGKRLVAFAPKNGYLYAFDIAGGQRLYKTPVTRIENNETPFSSENAVHFCPGTSGGAEWNGVAYDPDANLVFTGEVDWCTTVKLQPVAQLKAIAKGTFWSGNLNLNPLDLYGDFDPHSDWAGWLYATDADTGVFKWRAKSNYPILGGITPTAGGLVFFGDMGGNFYALDVRNGARLWSKKLDGAIGGGVVTYLADGQQKVAVAAGMTSLAWPAEITTAKIVVMGLAR